MARTRYQIFEANHQPYFLTATTVQWLPLFSNPTTAKILLDSLTFLIRQNRLTLFAYVLMENHIHMIAAANDLSKELALFKSFTARKCIDLYQQQNHEFVLDQLAVHKLAHKQDRDFQFWQEGSHPQQIIDREMMVQKVQYIHLNPVRRGYVDEMEQWRYSSARDYCGKPGLIPVNMEW